MSETSTQEAIDMKPVINSSQIKSAGYNPVTGQMHVEFNGGSLYEYDDISEEKWGEFEATFSEGNSTGGFFNKNFRSSKNYRRL